MIPSEPTEETLDIAKFKAKSYLKTRKFPKYKSYRKYALECDKNGNRFELDAPYVKGGILVCVKYKTYCHSKACLKERTDDL